MLERLPGIQARIAEIEQRLVALDARPAGPAPGPERPAFAETLAAASQRPASPVVPPAAVAAEGVAPTAVAEPALPPPPHWLRTGSASHDHQATVREAARRHGVDPSLAIAVARAESGFNPRAVSSAGAIGLMQLMPGTAQALGVDPYDPAQNADGGVRYLAEQLQRFGGDVRLALAAYNAGPNRVARYGGVPPIAETQRYVQRVLEYQQQVQRVGAP